MSVFSSSVGSPGCPDLDQVYPMEVSDDLREDASHELLERINIHEGIRSPNPWSGGDTNQQLGQCHTQSFINSLETLAQIHTAQTVGDI